MMLAAANPQAALEQMRRQELLNASPAQLTLKLFQRLILDLNRAAEALQGTSPGTAATHLVHAQAILSELDSTLDPSAWDGAEDLKSVYGYCISTIAAANRNADPVSVATALELITPVYEAFAEAARTPAVTP